MDREPKSVEVVDFIASWPRIIAEFESGAETSVDLVQDGKVVARVLPASKSLHGYLRGSVHIPSGTDLTAPAFVGETHASSGRVHE